MLPAHAPPVQNDKKNNRRTECTRPVAVRLSYLLNARHASLPEMQKWKEMPGPAGVCNKPTKEIQNTLAKTTTILKVDIQGNLYERRE